MHALLRNRNVPATSGVLLDKATQLLANASWDMADVMVQQDERREIDQQEELDQITRDTAALQQ